MFRLLTYLAGIPHHGSPLIFPTRTCPSKIIQDLAYIPDWRGEAGWWVLGKNASEVRAKKRDLTHDIPSKYITYLFSSPGASVGMRE